MGDSDKDYLAEEYPDTGWQPPGASERSLGRTFGMSPEALERAMQMPGPGSARMPYQAAGPVARGYQSAMDFLGRNMPAGSVDAAMAVMPGARRGNPKIATQLRELADDALEKDRPPLTWHASPYDFDKFRYGRGVGQNAQTFGEGHYFAEAKDVSGIGGRYDREMAGGSRAHMDFADSSPRIDLARGTRLAADVDPMTRAKIIAGQVGRSESFESVLRHLNQMIAQHEKNLRYREFMQKPENQEKYRDFHDIKEMEPFTEFQRGAGWGNYEGLLETRKIIEDWARRGGQASKNTIYRTQLMAPQDTFLDLDKPLNKQRVYVRDRLRDAIGRDKIEEFSRDALNGRGKPAQALLRTHWVEMAKLQEELAQLGVAGNSYWDGFSRNARSKDAKTANYVVYPEAEDIIDIRSKRPGLYTDGGEV